ncbi:MAG: PAS domain-containing protein, partial [Methylocella sp.]
MIAATGVIADLTRAFETANVEMLAVKLPEAQAVEATSAILRKWNASRDEIVGRALAKAGTGPLSARHLDDEGKIEVSYMPPLGAIRTIKLSPQTWNDGPNQYLVLIGQYASIEQVEEAVDNERRLSLALRSGGYAVWDHDYRTGVTGNTPEMYDLLGFERGSRDLNFNTFNELVHPEDRHNTLDGQIRIAPFGSDMFQTRYRVKQKSGNYIWIESIAGVIRSPVDGKPMKCVGLSRNIGDQMVALDKMQASESILRRSQQAARL